MKNVTKTMVASVLLGAAGVAQAGFIAIDASAPVASTIGIVGHNDFVGNLSAIGIDTYTLGASLGVDAAGSLTYYYYGKEAGYENVFEAGALSYSSGVTPTWQNYFGAPIELGTMAVGPGLLDFQFCAYSGSSAQGCVTNAQNDGLDIHSFQSIAFSITRNVAWLFWDDSGAGPDDNHDDMLIKAVFTPATSVPEPGTLTLFGLGLLGVGFLARRRQRRRVA